MWHTESMNNQTNSLGTKDFANGPGEPLSDYEDMCSELVRYVAEVVDVLLRNDHQLTWV